MMIPQDNRPSLFHRALGVFVVLALFLSLFLWLGKTFIQRQIEKVHLDTHRLSTLRTFEHAFVALESLPHHDEPTPDRIREKLQFCADSLDEHHRKSVSERDRRINPCANSNAPEELACYLRTINTKLGEMGGDGRFDRNRMLGQIYVVSIDRWADAIRIAQGQQTPGSPMRDSAQEKHEKVTCRDALGAARQLAANDGKLLEKLAWRDLTTRRVVDEQFTPDQLVKVTDRILEQRNPWGGVPGCIYYGEGSPDGKVMFVTDKRQRNRQACFAMRPREIEEKNLIEVFRKSAIDKLDANDTTWTLPESLEVILADLDNIRLPWRDLYHAYTEKPKDPGEPNLPTSVGNVAVAHPHGPNELERSGHKVEVGFNVHLTINPDSQRTVQQVAKCYAGDLNICQQIGLIKDKQFGEFIKQMYENAAVRMVAVTIVDIPTGKIDALGSAHSDCYRQEYDGPGRHVGDCPDLPTTPHYEPDRLLNHALFTDAQPGSIIKPVMATGFFRDPGYRNKLVADRISGNFTRLQDELKSSDSVAFLNRMFCREKAWTKCQRPRYVQEAAVLLGWDQGCSETSTHCGRLDVLFGRPSYSRIRKDTDRAPLGSSVMYGRLLTEVAPPTQWVSYQLMRDFSFNPQLAGACSRGDHYRGNAANRAWRKCKGGHFVAVESEGWGQGNARATAAGVAGMMARLAAAANGQTSLPLPYLVDRITDAAAEKYDLAAHQFHLADPIKLEIPKQDAIHILEGMISHKSLGVPKGTRSGTAHGACIRVFDAAKCNRIDWIAGKTGTPPYGNDGLSLAAIKKKCSVEADKNLPDDEQQEWRASCTRERPYKWYVAVFKTNDKQRGFNKAIAVLTERNWHKSGPLAGKVNSPGDRGEANASAEIAFRIIDRIRDPR